MFVATICAPGTIAPDLSVTVPYRVVVVCALKKNEHANKPTRAFLNITNLMVVLPLCISQCEIRCTVYCKSSLFGYVRPAGENAHSSEGRAQLVAPSLTSRDPFGVVPGFAAGL